MESDGEAILKMVADTFMKLKGNRPHLTTADIRRAMKDLNPIGCEVEGLAAALYKDLSVGKDDDEHIVLNDWIEFFRRVNTKAKIQPEDIAMMNVVLGIWPIDEQIKVEWCKTYYAVQSQDAPTMSHLVKATEAILDLDSPDESEEVVADILYGFIPDYIDGRVLTMSEWLGFWARFAIEEPLPNLMQFPAIRRSIARVRPSTQKSIEATPIQHDAT